MWTLPVPLEQHGFFLYLFSSHFPLKDALGRNIQHSPKSASALLDTLPSAVLSSYTRTRCSANSLEPELALTSFYFYNVNAF